MNAYHVTKAMWNNGANWDKQGFVTGTGQKLQHVHKETEDCRLHGCCIHNPTDPHQDWPTHYSGGSALMMCRKCPCGQLHPDKDWLSFVKRTYGDTEYEYQVKWHAKTCKCRCCEAPLDFTALLLQAWR